MSGRELGRAGDLRSGCLNVARLIEARAEHNSSRIAASLAARTLSAAFNTQYLQDMPGSGGGPWRGCRWAIIVECVHASNMTVVAPPSPATREEVVHTWSVGRL